MTLSSGKGGFTPAQRGRVDSTPEGGDPGVPAQILKDLATEEGFELAGIAPAEPSRHTEFLRQWIEAGHHGEMGYLADPEMLRRRSHPALTFPGVKSILVVAQSYYLEDSHAMTANPSRGIIARYARGRDYHRVLRGRLERVHRRLEERLGQVVPGRSYVDTGPLLERELARLAGLGWFGRNTMLIHPRKGSFFFLGALLLEIELEPDSSFEEDRCGTCHSCLDACPTGALLGRDANGAPVMDATRCISYLTIENRGPIPAELRPAIGNRIYGCDICQEVCPFNERFSTPTSEAGYAARGPGERPVGVEALPGEERMGGAIAGEIGRNEGGEAAHPPSGTLAPGLLHPGTDNPPLIALLEMALDEQRWEVFSRGSAIRRAGREGFARNVCVALGNWGDPAAVPVLSDALNDPGALIREHAAWALARIGSTPRS